MTGFGSVDFPSFFKVLVAFDGNNKPEVLDDDPSDTSITIFPLFMVLMFGCCVFLDYADRGGFDGNGRYTPI